MGDVVSYGSHQPARAAFSSLIRSDIPVWQLEQKLAQQHAQFGAGLALSLRSPGVLQIGFVGTDALPICSTVVELNVWQLGFNGYKKGPAEL